MVEVAGLDRTTGGDGLDAEVARRSTGQIAARQERRVNIHDWAVAVSDHAIMFAAIVYALAFVGHIVEWSTRARWPPHRREAVEVPEAVATAPASPAQAPRARASQPPVHDERRELRPSSRPDRRRAHGASAPACTCSALVARGLATDPVRVPWGNMYEFTLAGTLRRGR